MGDNQGFYHSAWNGHGNWSAALRQESHFSNYDWVLFVVNAAMMLLSLSGNICVIYFICGQKKARTTPNITVVSIAVAHILTSAFVVPTYFAVSKYNMASEHIAPFLCKLNIYIWYWCKTVNIYSIAAMVCDRYNRFIKPLKMRNNMSGRFMFFLSFVWFFGAAYNIWEIVLNSSAKTLLELSDKSANITTRRCGPSGDFRYLHNGFLIVDFVVIYALPFTVVAFFFSSIIHLTLYPNERLAGQRITGRRRLALSALLFCLFYSCQLPYEVVDAITYFSAESFSHRFSALLKLCEAVSFSQGFLNVVAYASCSMELHHTIQKRYQRRRLVRGTSPPLMQQTSLQIPEILLSCDPTVSQGVVMAIDCD